MPTYVYRCKKGHEFEVFHSITDETPRRCPQCRSGAKRVPAGGAGFLFKGSGFYITDHRSESYREKAKAEQGGAGQTGTTGGGSSGSDAGTKGGTGTSPGTKPGRGGKSSARSGGGKTPPSS